MRFKKNLSYACINTSPLPQPPTPVSFPLNFFFFFLKSSLADILTASVAPLVRPRSRPVALKVIQLVTTKK